MSTSEQRRATNRANALLSTGPKTVDGRAISRTNATKHGFLSARLLLADENRDEFEGLRLALTEDLQPVGLIELAIVERIAIGLWRQRRLVTAETAYLAISRRSAVVAKVIAGMYDPDFGGGVKSEDLEPFDEDHENWCRDVLAEIAKIEGFTVPAIEKDAPLVFRQLCEDAKREEQSLDQYLADFDRGLVDFVKGLEEWCRGELESARMRPRLLQMAELVRHRHQVLAPDQLELFARYQSALDNQLNKALRALRDAQAWRLQTLEARGAVVEPDAEQAAA